MPASVIAKTPNTAIRKIWEITQKAGAESFIILSAWRSSGWSVTEEQLAEEQRKKHPMEYIGEPDPARDQQINQDQDQKLRDMIKNLRRRGMPLNGLGQEVDPISKELKVSSEKSYLIPGVSRAQGEALDRQFNQDAVICGKAGESTFLLGWDRSSNEFSTWAEWTDMAVYKDRSVDPKGDYQEDTPGSAQYRSDVSTAPGVGYVFYSMGSVLEGIKGTVDRMREQGMGQLPEASVVERAWMDWTKKVEAQIRGLRNQNQTSEADVAEGKFKKLVKDAARDPEGMVKFLVGGVLGQPNALGIAKQEVNQ